MTSYPGGNPDLAGRSCPRVSARARRIAVAAGLLLAVVAAFPRDAQALDVEQVRWGFDGQVVSRQFNLLSLLVSNPSTEAFDGKIELHKTANGRRIDAPLVETVYLAPHSSRWVQFHPYCKLDWEEWSVSWEKPRAGRYDLPRPRPGKPTCVLLDESDTLSVGPLPIKRFPENLFPVSTTATDGLAAVVLDHVPRWEEGRQRAFLDWVRLGGEVHLLHSLQKDYPHFTGTLRVLNGEAPRQHVGVGVVHRHPRERRELDAPFVEKVIIAGRGPEGLSGGAALTSAVPDDDVEESADPMSYQWETDTSVLNALKKMSRPDHNWWLIHLMSLVYIGLIFPGCFTIGRKRGGDYRFVFGGLLTIVATFSMAFLIVGRRGYGERTSVHAVAIARVMGDGRCDVSQWSNAFVVDGGDYELAHAGTGRIYSTCQDQEAVRREITNGPEAGFLADMPPFSSRTFGHRVLLQRIPTGGASVPPVEEAPADAPADEAAPAPLRVTEWRTQLVTRPPETMVGADNVARTLRARPEPVIEHVTLVKGADFPVEYQDVHAIFGRRVYSVTESAGRFELKSESEVGTLLSFLRPEQHALMDYFEDWSNLEGTPDEIFHGLYRPLLARACGVNSLRDARKFALPANRLRLVVYSPMPPEFFVKNERFSGQRGFVLYCFDVTPPDS